jgi:hypothetical protein
MDLMHTAHVPAGKGALPDRVQWLDDKVLRSIALA